MPSMHPFPGEMSILIMDMDNCSIHHVQEVKDLLEAAGILLMFLPPYIVLITTQPRNSLTSNKKHLKCNKM